MDGLRPILKEGLVDHGGLACHGGAASQDLLGLGSGRNSWRAWGRLTLGGPGRFWALRTGAGVSAEAGVGADAGVRAAAFREIEVGTAA